MATTPDDSHTTFPDAASLRALDGLSHPPVRRGGYLFALTLSRGWAECY